MGAHVSVPMYRRSLPQRLRLEGARCDRCSEVFFPPRGRCASCGNDVLKTHALAGRGRLEAVTFITAASAPPEFASEAARRGGYHVGIVGLEEGPRITAQLVDGESPPGIGDPVDVVFRRLYEEEGVIRYGFKFTTTR